jgi:hypothetical protein
MNIILNEAKEIRMTCSDNLEYHSFTDIYFYIPKTLSLDDNKIRCLIDNTTELNLTITTQVSKNYFIYNVVLVGNENIYIEKGKHLISLIGNNFQTNTLTVTLDELDTSSKIIVQDRKILISSDDIGTIIQGDNKARYLEFRMDKFSNGVDLSKKSIIIKYINANGKSFRTNVTDVVVENDYIYFSWLITTNVSAAAGTVVFAIEAAGDEDEKGNLDTFIWQTDPASFIVSSGLGTDPTESELEMDELPAWYKKIYNNFNSITKQISDINSQIDILSEQAYDATIVWKEA